MELEPLERGVSILRDRSGGTLKLLMDAVGLLDGPALSGNSKRVHTLLQPALRSGIR